MPKLYQLADQYLKFNEYVENILESDEDLTEEDLQTLIDTLDSIKDEFAHKVENIAKLLKYIEGNIKMYEAEEERLKKRRKALQNTYDRIKEYTKDMMELAKIDKIQAGVFKLKLQKNPPSVHIYDAKRIPEEYLIPQDPKIDNKKLLEVLKSGELVDGAELITDKKHLRII